MVVGNWKLHKTTAEAAQLVRAIKGKLAGARDTEVGVAPVFTALETVGKALEGSNIRLCGQDVHFEDQGAFTGEVSAPLLSDVACSMCIVGHSERRQLFGETDETVRKKLGALLSHELTPIVCIGETLEQREAGKALDVVRGQLDAAYQGVSAEQAAATVIAYEPVWAIGTGRTASPGDAQEVHEAIRARLRETYGAVADGVRLLYGGSVKPNNAADLMAQGDIDGALVGGASLEADSFVAIAEAAG